MRVSSIRAIKPLQHLLGIRMIGGSIATGNLFALGNSTFPLQSSPLNLAGDFGPQTPLRFGGAWRNGGLRTKQLEMNTSARFARSGMTSVYGARFVTFGATDKEEAQRPRNAEQSIKRG